MPTTAVTETCESKFVASASFCARYSARQSAAIGRSRLWNKFKKSSEPARELSRRLFSARGPLRLRPALPTPSLHRDLRQDRHRDFFRRDRAEVEAGRGLDPLERCGFKTFADQFLAQRRHLA